MPPATVMMSVDSSGRSATPSALTAASTWRVLPVNRQDVAAEHLRLGKDWYLDHVAA